MATLMLRTLVSRSLMIPRSMSTLAGKYTDTKLEDKFATLTMKHPPANILTSDLMLEISDQIQELENSSNIHGLILTSSVKKVFSSGLDLNLMLGFGNDIDKAREYYTLFQNLWFQLFKSRLVVIAAINGHAIAGGCGLALACDYRLMANENFGIGITSALIGIPMPHYLLETMQRTTSWSRGNMASQQARIFKPEEALKIGLLDEIVPSEELLQAAERQMNLYLKTNHKARVATKMDAKSDLISRFEKMKQDDMEQLARILGEGETRDVILKQLDAMKSRKSRD